MSKEFLERLSNGQLTQVDQYRRMQAELNKIESTGHESAGDNEEWKQWQLEPVSAGRPDNSKSDFMDPLSDSAQDLYKAIRVLDKK